MIPSFSPTFSFLITSQYVQTHEILSVPLIYLKTLLLDFCLLPLDFFSRLAAQLSRIPFHSYPGENSYFSCLPAVVFFSFFFFFFKKWQVVFQNPGSGFWDLLCQTIFRLLSKFTFSGCRILGWKPCFPIKELLHCLLVSSVVVTHNIAKSKILNPENTHWKSFLLLFPPSRV